jgi:outer membrane immunogenic protein
MNTRSLIKLGLAIVMLSSASAVSEAADAARGPAYRPPPRPLPFYTWTGLYVGAHVGGGWADLGGFNSGSGFIGGGQVGYNYQFSPQWVVGVEVEVSGSGIKNNLANAPFIPATIDLNWNVLTTVASRFGYAFDNWLVYGKVGGAWADISVSVNSPFFTGSTGGGTASGWMVGVGTEYAFRNNWSAKIEYNHLDFGGDAGTFITGNTVTVNTVKAGVNYHFGGFPF